MLGIRRGTVELRSHCETWSILFASERADIANALGTLAIDIQHIGSTAVPGLDAKPVIDIAIGVKRSSDCPRCIAPLEGLGYGYIGNRRERGGHIFAKEDGDILTHALHLLEFQRPQWRNYLVFRDYLRACREARERYASLKRSLLEMPGIEHRSYSDGKASLIQQLLAEALASRHER